MSSSQSATGGNILQRSLNVPVVKATTSVSLSTTSSSLTNKPSIIVSTPTVTTATTSSLGNIITVASSAGGSSTTGILWDLVQGSRSHGKSGKVMEKFLVIESHGKSKKISKVMEK